MTIFTLKQFLIFFFCCLIVGTFLAVLDLWWLTALVMVGIFVPSLWWWKQPVASSQDGQINNLTTAPIVSNLLKYSLWLWKFEKILCVLILPLAVGLSVLFCYLDQIETGTPWDLSRGLIIGTSFGLFWTILFLPSWFVKQDANPSKFQRNCRQMFLFIHVVSFHLGAFLANEKLAALLFKYWLSHPGVLITDELAKRLAYINPNSFDWQNPLAWPLDREFLMPPDLIDPFDENNHSH